MTLNRVKLVRTVTFLTYLASAAFLIFLAKTLIWDKITFPSSNSLRICSAGGKQAYEVYLQKKLPTFLFLFNLSLVNVKISRHYY